MMHSMKSETSVIVDSQHREVYRLADNLAVHFFGNKPPTFYESEIDRNGYDRELEVCRKDVEASLKGKPQDLQDKIMRGKFMKYLETATMEHQIVGFEESDFTIGEYLKEFERKNKGTVRITTASRFGI